MGSLKLRHGNDLLAIDYLWDCDVHKRSMVDCYNRTNASSEREKAGKKPLRQAIIFEKLALCSKAERFADREYIWTYEIYQLLWKQARRNHQIRKPRRRYSMDTFSKSCPARIRSVINKQYWDQQLFR
ncbi:hypothetical protein pipiens_009316 [Culex pipiens pipiens]|uniref:Uncharacterized protein n=1 Tax=Culex pipiens pipiens TaxID=38569 RepID=A0ABD1DEG1_CULPP